MIINKSNINEPQCNCRSECILPGQCRKNCVIYKATTIHKNNNIKYIDNTSFEFKAFYRNHKANFLNEDATEKFYIIKNYCNPGI